MMDSIDGVEKIQDKARATCPTEIRKVLKKDVGSGAGNMSKGLGSQLRRVVNDIIA